METRKLGSEHDDNFVGNIHSDFETETFYLRPYICKEALTSTGKFSKPGN